MTFPLIKLKQLLSKGLEQTAALWSPITIAYNWVHHAAQILDNHVEFDAPIVQLCFGALIEAMSVYQTSAGYVLEGVIHFLKVAPLLLVRAILLLLDARFTRKLDGGILPHQTSAQNKQLMRSIFLAPCAIITVVVQVAPVAPSSYQFK